VPKSPVAAGSPSAIRRAAAGAPSSSARLGRPADRAALRDASSRSTPITAGDFARPLDRSSIRAVDGFRSSQAFARQWRSSLATPVLFFRSFPSAYYRDLRAISARGVPGGRGIILGDPHPNNFGFIRTARGTEFVYNDFDDSGRGPVAIDALRYFTALRLAFPGGEHLFEHTLDAYVKAVDRSATTAPPKSLAPSWSEVRAQNLEKYTSQETFKLDSDKTRLSAASSRTTDDVRTLVARDKRFGGATVLDVAMRDRDHGGSAGLPRVWVLVKRPSGELGIIEFKTAAPPATDQLGGERLPASERMDILKSAFFRAPAQDDLFSVKMRGATYLVRDRSRMSNVAIDDLSTPVRDDTLRAQATVMADVHRSGWTGVEAGAMRAWIDASSRVLARRWQDAFERATH
jgi:uncharacterized protein (DUF2252 family)